MTVYRQHRSCQSAFQNVDTCLPSRYSQYCVSCLIHFQNYCCWALLVFIKCTFILEMFLTKGEERLLGVAYDGLPQKKVCPKGGKVGILFSKSSGYILK